MCKAWEDHFNSERKMGIEKNIAQGRIGAIQRMLKKNVSKEFIMDLGNTDCEYE